MKSHYYVSLSALIVILACCTAEISKSHSLVKRQLPSRSSRTFPLSRSRQFPAPEELEETDVADSKSEEDTEYDERSEEDPSTPRRFRGRQQPPTDEDYHFTEVPLTTTPAPQTESTKAPTRAPAFNSRPSRPRFGAQPRVTTTSTTSTPKQTSASSRFRSRSSSAPTQRIDVTAETAAPRSRSIAVSRNSNNREPVRKPLLDETNSPATRRIGTGGRVRGRGRPRSRSTTTTTTTTTTPAPEEEEYYYYYDDEEGGNKQPLVTTTSTTTTTTTKRPSLPRRSSLGRGRPAASNSRATAKPRGSVKFDPESQFIPPPEGEEETAPEVIETTRVTKRFTTSTTEAPGPGGIPAHLKGKYKPRTDGRFVDYLRDPNRPRELKGFDLTDYPFYIRVPEEIEFDCDDKKDGYYASVPHHCQLFHYCFAGSRYDFLCANYTLYDQTTFTCRFANNVDCPSSANYYYRNDDLWKETTTTAAPTPEPKRKKITPKDDDSEEEYEYDEEYDDEDEEDTKRRRRPSRRRNRRRKNKTTNATEATS